MASPAFVGKVERFSIWGARSCQTKKAERSEKWCWVLQLFCGGRLFPQVLAPHWEQLEKESGAQKMVKCAFCLMARRGGGGCVSTGFKDESIISLWENEPISYPGKHFANELMFSILCFKSSSTQRVTFKVKYRIKQGTLQSLGYPEITTMAWAQTVHRYLQRWFHCCDCTVDLQTAL